MSDKVMLDGREVKVGDTLWNLDQEVRVEKINFGLDYCIATQEVDGRRYDLNFRADGRNTHYMPRTLFWQKVTITPPAPPVEPCQWLIRSIEGRYWLTDSCPDPHEYMGIDDVVVGKFIPPE